MVPLRSVRRKETDHKVRLTCTITHSRAKQHDDFGAALCSQGTKHRTKRFLLEYGWRRPGEAKGPRVGFSLGGVSGKALGRSRGVSLAYQYCPLSAFSLKKGRKRLQGQKRKDAAESLAPGVGSPQGSSLIQHPNESGV